MSNTFLLFHGLIMMGNALLFALYAYATMSNRDPRYKNRISPALALWLIWLPIVNIITFVIGFVYLLIAIMAYCFIPEFGFKQWVVELIDQRG